MFVLLAAPLRTRADVEVVVGMRAPGETHGLAELGHPHAPAMVQALAASNQPMRPCRAHFGLNFLASACRSVLEHAHGTIDASPVDVDLKVHFGLEISIDLI
jgi:hypothetical protein